MLAYYTDHHGGEITVEYSAETLAELKEQLPTGTDAEELIKWAQKRRWRIDVGTLDGYLMQNILYGAPEEEALHDSNVQALNALLTGFGGHYDMEYTVQAEINSVAWVLGLNYVRQLEKNYPILDEEDYYQRLYEASKEFAVEELSFLGHDRMIAEYPPLAKIPQAEWLLALIQAQEDSGEIGHILQSSLERYAKSDGPLPGDSTN